MCSNDLLPRRAGRRKKLGRQRRFQVPVLKIGELRQLLHVTNNDLAIVSDDHTVLLQGAQLTVYIGKAEAKRVTDHILAEWHLKGIFIRQADLSETSQQLKKEMRNAFPR